MPEFVQFTRVNGGEIVINPDHVVEIMPTSTDGFSVISLTNGAKETVSGHPFEVARKMMKH